jgi:auxin responsive GH3 family protein
VQVFDGGRAGLLQRLFPRLFYMSSILTGSMSKYVPHLRQLLPSIPFLSAMYGATAASAAAGCHGSSRG